MRWKRSSRCAIGGVLLLSAAASRPATGEHFEILELAPGVYAALQPAALRFADSNSVILVNEEDITVVDAQGNPADVRRLIPRIRALSMKPVRHVVLTHYHTDHVWSFALYADAYPGVELVGHESLREDVSQLAGQTQLEEEIAGLSKALPEARERFLSRKTAEGNPMSDEHRASLERAIVRAEARLSELRLIEVVPPSVTFEDRLTLHRGPRSIELLHLPGHTRGDVVVFLPREKILITGDLLDDMPSGGKGFLSDWLESLNRLEALDFETIVPGHGRPHQGKDHLVLIRELLQAIQSGARRGVEAGLSLEETKAQIDLEPFRLRLAGDDELANRVFRQFIPATIERAYEEAAP